MALSGLDHGAHVWNAGLGAALRALGCRVNNLVLEWLCPVHTCDWRDRLEGLYEVRSP